MNNIKPIPMDVVVDHVGDGDETQSNVLDRDAVNLQLDVVPFEVETYAAQYSGYNKLCRLIYIADHCPPLKVDALEQALKHIKSQTCNVNMYKTLQERLARICEQNGQPVLEPYDARWVEHQTNLAQLVLDKLENDLKNYKSNSIKESIRRAYDDLGTHYLNCGDLHNSLKCYNRSWEYCTNHQVFDVCLNVIKLNIYLENWIYVNSFIRKAEANESRNADASVKTRIDCLLGLHDLVTQHYKSAAENFVKAHFDQIGHSFTSIMSANNVTVYGGLCALATFDRDDLRRKVVQSVNFRQLLELEPQLREAINRFVDSKYPECIKLLDELKDAYLLDLHLAPHIDTLYRMIRNRALIQYFAPYLSADLNLMARAFNTTVAALEEELIPLILEEKVQARIDSRQKILYAKDNDPRFTIFETVLEKGRVWQMKATTLILQTACANNGLITLRQIPSASQLMATSTTTINNTSSSSGGGGGSSFSSTNNSSKSFPPLINL